MPINLYKCEKCGAIYDVEDKCNECERTHSEFEKALRTSYTYREDRTLPTHITILSPLSNNKPYGKCAEYVLSKTWDVKDPSEDKAGTMKKTKTVNPQTAMWSPTKAISEVDYDDIPF